MGKCSVRNSFLVENFREPSSLACGREGVSVVTRPVSVVALFSKEQATASNPYAKCPTLCSLSAQ